MKKIVSILMVSAMMLSLVGCGAKTETTQASNDAETQTIKVEETQKQVETTEDAELKRQEEESKRAIEESIKAEELKKEEESKKAAEEAEKEQARIKAEAEAKKAAEEQARIQAEAQAKKAAEEAAKAAQAQASQPQIGDTKIVGGHTWEYQGTPSGNQWVDLDVEDDEDGGSSPSFEQASYAEQAGQNISIAPNQSEEDKARARKMQEEGIRAGATDLREYRNTIDHSTGYDVDW